MKIASRATPKGLAGHGLSTTALEISEVSVNPYSILSCNI